MPCWTEQGNEQRPGRESVSSARHGFKPGSFVGSIKNCDVDGGFYL
jgi:hypothetical protein